ncbi:MAG: hypothetical protein E7075_00115 [Bacteroidales bacterium]|nr:hypothetical protein [Bacteroidales bacterium]
MATPHTDYWAKVEQDMIVKLSNRYGVSENSAKDIINMVSSLCSTRGAALMWIEKYLNNHG